MVVFRKAIWRWFTDKEGKRFIYIRPDEVRDFEELGWEVKEGPRGGYRAYPPVNWQGSLGEVRRLLYGSEGWEPEQVEVGEEKGGIVGGRLPNETAVEEFIDSVEDEYLRDLLMYIYEQYVEGDFRNFFNNIRMGIEEGAEDAVRQLLELMYGEAGKYIMDVAKELMSPKVFNREALKGIYEFYDDPYEMFWSMFFDIVGYGLEGIKEKIVKGRERNIFTLRALEIVEMMKKAFGEDSVQYKMAKEALEFVKSVEKKLNYVLSVEPFEVPDDVAKSLADKLFEKFSKEIGEGLFSIERFSSWLFEDEVREAFGKFFSMLINAFSLFRRLGVSDKEAAVLARGATLMRLWTSLNFKRYTGFIERIVHEIEGNDRRLRLLVESFPDEDAHFLIVNDFLKKEDLVSWKKVVVNYLKLWRERGGNEYQKDVPEGKIRVFRGMGAIEAAALVADAILNNGVARYTGTMYSFAVEPLPAFDFARVNVLFTTVVDIDRAYGCWLNASKNADASEAEVILSIPHEGLPGKLVMLVEGELVDFDTSNWEANFSAIERVFNEFYEDMATTEVKDSDFLSNVRRMVVQALKKMYSEAHSKEVKERLENLLKRFGGEL